MTTKGAESTNGTRVTRGGLAPCQGSTEISEGRVTVVKGTSAYAQRMNAAGKEIFGCEIDVALADGIRAIAAKEEIKVSALLKREWAALLRANGIAYAPTDPGSKLSAAEAKVAELEAKLAALEAQGKE